MNVLKDKTVLVTGGTGSFGGTFARFALSSGAENVRVLSRDEAKQDQMRQKVADDRLEFYIGDTREIDSVRRAVRGSHIIFHAAALKQVPSAEFFPIEAVRTNVLGSKNVLDAAYDFGVQSAVFLSTDKAVYPINAMGQSKALMEKTVLSYARQFPESPTKVAVTRYGNVMFSRGSVIPRFINEALDGKPLTITDGSMTRFLMSLDESVDLVLRAVEEEETGLTLVRKSPATTIATLAAAVSEIVGNQHGEVNEIGFRHGEKLFETLLSSEEMPFARDLGDYFAVPIDDRDLNYASYFSVGQKRSEEGAPSYNSHNTKRLDLPETVDVLLSVNEIRERLKRG